VDPVPDPLLLRKSGSAGNRTRASGSVAKIFDHYTRVALIISALYCAAARWQNLKVLPRLFRTDFRNLARVVVPNREVRV
jgi:hypothetical protein